MKYLLIGGAVVAIVAYAWTGKGEANVYDMPVTDAYAKLKEAKGPLRDNGNERFVQSGGDGSSTVRWFVGGSSCQADLTPDSSGTRITAYCTGGGEGAATGMFAAMMRKQLIEHIDSTLDGRDYDKRKALGETAALWPADVRQPDGSFGTAVNEAIKMDRDMRQGMKEFEKEAKKQSTAQRMEMKSQMPSSATRPMTDLSH